MSRPRVQTRYSLFRAETGRLTSGVDSSDSDKVASGVRQVQNVPKKLRDLFAADPGWVMLGADWAAIQFALVLRRAAELNVPVGFHANLLERQQAGTFDPHRHLAAFFISAWMKEVKRVHREPTQQDLDEARQIAKGFTYGLMFKGRGVTVAKERRLPIRMGLIVEPAYSEAFKLGHWQQFECDLAAENHFIETAGGFRRMFHGVSLKNDKGEWTYPKPQEVLASVIQGDEADLLKATLLRVVEELGPGLRCDWLEMLTTTHDSLLFQAREDRVDDAKAKVLKWMEGPVTSLGRGFRAEIKTGPNWRAVS